jgi:hypothetical protein
MKYTLRCSILLAVLEQRARRLIMSNATVTGTSSELFATRAEVAAGAVVEARTHSMEPAGSRVVTYKSTADRAAVRAQAAEAVRTGQIPSGEFSAT